MALERKPVTVNLVTELKQGYDKERVALQEAGEYFHKGNMHVLKFTEHHDEGLEVRTMITIYPEKVVISRSGAVTMKQVFIPKQKTENAYQHPHGVLHMETKTENIEHKQSKHSSKGRLFISYLLWINGEVEQRTRLTLTYEEEAKK